MACGAYQTKVERPEAAPTGLRMTSSACWSCLAFTGHRYVLSLSFPHGVVASSVHIQAPSEGEAELAAMNAHGVIDAVMTEDSDILIFGAPCVIRRYAIVFLSIRDH